MLIGQSDAKPRHVIPRRAVRLDLFPTRTDKIENFCELSQQLKPSSTGRNLKIQNRTDNEADIGSVLRGRNDTRSTHGRRLRRLLGQRWRHSPSLLLRPLPVGRVSYHLLLPFVDPYQLLLAPTDSLDPHRNRKRSFLQYGKVKSLCAAGFVIGKFIWKYVDFFTDFNDMCE